MAQKLKFGNGTWATKEGSTLAYNDESNNFKPLPFSFTRDSIATRVNKEGLIEVVGNDKPRIDYTDSAEGVLLLENSATNLVTYSEDFSNSSWVKLGAGTGSAAIVTSDYAISPDGTQNASRLQCELNGGLTSSGNQSLIYHSIIGSGDTTGFIYVKSNTSSSQNFYLANSLNDLVIGVATKEWQKFNLNWIGGGNNRSLSLGARGTSNSDDSLDLLIWGAQVEANSVASSYIPTSGSSIQRAAETCNGSGNSEVFNDSEGVLYADISALSNDGTYRMISLSDGTVNNSTNIQFSGVSNQIRTRVENGGSPQADITSTVTSQTLFNKIAVLYKSNKFELWLNGFKVGEDTSGTPPSGINKLSFDRGDGGNDFYGKTKELAYYDSADIDLEYLTSYRSLNELVTELNLNTL